MTASARETRTTDQPVDRLAQPPQDVHVEVAVLAADRAHDAPDRVRRRAGDRTAARMLGVEGVVLAKAAEHHHALGPSRRDGVVALGRKRCIDRFAIGEQVLRHEAPEFVVTRGDVVLQAADERSRDVGRHGGHEPQPVRGQRRREHRHAQDARLASNRRAEPAHQVFVREVVGATRVVHPASGLVDVPDAHQVFEQVGERDGRGLRLHPLRREHERQVVDQVADHLVRGRAGPDDDAGADFRDRYRALPQPLAGLAAGHEMLGVRVVRNQSAQIDDAAHARGSRRAREVFRGLQVEAAEIAPGSHRMDEVVGHVDAVQRRRERLRPQRVGLDDVHAGPAARLEHLAIAPRGANRAALAQQPDDEIGADIAGRTENQFTLHVGCTLVDSTTKQPDGAVPPRRNREGRWPGVRFGHIGRQRKDQGMPGWPRRERCLSSSTRTALPRGAGR